MALRPCPGHHAVEDGELVGLQVAAQNVAESSVAELEEFCRLEDHLRIQVNSVPDTKSLLVSITDLKLQKPLPLRVLYAQKMQVGQDLGDTFIVVRGCDIRRDLGHQVVQQVLPR